MNIHTSKAFNKYGIWACSEAHVRNRITGDGASTIAFEFGLTTRQVDCAINAWDAVLASCKTGDKVHGLGERFVIEQHGSRFKIRPLSANT